MEYDMKAIKMDPITIQNSNAVRVRLQRQLKHNVADIIGSEYLKGHHQSETHQPNFFCSISFFIGRLGKSADTVSNLNPTIKGPSKNWLDTKVKKEVGGVEDGGQLNC